MVRIDELAIPASLDAEGGAAFARAIDIGNAVEAVTYGTTDLAYGPEEGGTGTCSTPRRPWASSPSPTRAPDERI